MDEEKLYKLAEEVLEEGLITRGKQQIRKYVKITTAFEIAFKKAGCNCDICHRIVEIHAHNLSKSAERAVSNIDGQIKLMLCVVCASRFETFCQREFETTARIPYSYELEQMMIAHIAQVV